MEQGIKLYVPWYVEHEEDGVSFLTTPVTPIALEGRSRA